MNKPLPKLVSPEVSENAVLQLNAVLKNELTGINQYFLHARILKHMGFMKLADFEYKESLDEMKHADQIINRILFLGGLPNLQALGALRIGQKVDEILKADLALEDAARSDLKAAISHYTDEGDTSTATMLQSILDSEDQHVQFIRTQLNLIDTMGLTAYLQTQV